MLQVLLLGFLCFVFIDNGPVAAREAAERQFRAWLEEDVWPRAQRRGVSRPIFDAAFSGVTLNWDLPDLIPPGEPKRTPKVQRQAEFGSPARYFNPNSIKWATSVGQQMQSRHASALANMARKTGVPARIVLAIWGRESGYGRVEIPHNVFEVLGTKGFMSTRAVYFTDELLAALEIAQAGHAPGKAMKSSWAGALGQPQFMPSSFLRYAIDGNGDGRADIWASESDTIASIGNYLARHGWNRARDWGFEVRLPASVSCSLEGPDQGKRFREWAAMGVERVSGKPFPAKELPREGFLMLPAGRYGPAFIVTENFYVLKDYNKSDLYALFVGHVGDRISYGVGDFAGPWKRIDRLYRSDIAAMQRALEARGHDVGGADGLPGYKTRRSIGRWQDANGYTQTCFPDAQAKASLVN